MLSDHGNAINDVKFRQIIALYRNHARLKEICQKADVCPETIRKYRKLAGVSGRYRLTEKR